VSIVGGASPIASPLVQYIEEIPPTRPHVTQLTTWQAVCAQCGKVHTTTHPRQVSRAQGAASVHLGPRAEALAALLNKQVSDCLASYDPPRYRKHKCIAHHTFTPLADIGSERGRMPVA